MNLSPRRDKRGIDLISDALPFGRLTVVTQDRAGSVFDCRTADWRQSPERQSGEEAPCLAAHLVQSDNHREAPWLVMKCARESWFD
jgi:hypothetical protein